MSHLRPTLLNLPLDILENITSFFTAQKTYKNIGLDERTFFRFRMSSKLLLGLQSPKSLLLELMKFAGRRGLVYLCKELVHLPGLSLAHKTLEYMKPWHAFDATQFLSFSSPHILIRMPMNPSSWNICAKWDSLMHSLH